MMGFKAFNVYDLESCQTHFKKVELENLSIYKNIKRQLTLNKKKVEIKSFSESCDYQDSNFLEQTKFVLKLAQSGLSKHLNLIDTSNLDASISSLDNARVIIALYDNVMTAIGTRHSNTYITSLKPLERVREAHYAMLSSTPSNSILNTAWSLKNDADLSRFSTSNDSLGLCLGETSYNYTKLALSSLSFKFSVWLNCFIDQVSFLGAGFNTVTKLFTGLDSYIFESVLPESESGTYFDPMKLNLSLYEYEQWCEDDEINVQSYLCEKLAECLNFNASFKGSVKKARSNYYNSLLDKIEIDDEIEQFIKSCNEQKEFGKSYGFSSINVELRDFHFHTDLDYPDSQCKSITSQLRHLLALAPLPVNSTESSIINFLHDALKGVRELDHVSLHCEELSIADARIVHVEVDGLNESVQECIHSFEADSLMQMSSGSWTGVDDFDANDLKMLIDGEAVSAALINGLYSIISSPDSFSNAISL
ncbi:hypothetical protein THF1C08_50246 [Vibrio jasicida]|uniref:Uncharacterized protein n=1 Tax=Vibrio jasicida TaxID=766224 RepID=A0AAU9QT99_9VIBR|nr:hypothetical protein THF1C08_50246 [Vibrio jasicida]CAH1601553.1 hypothetical protein THF1A12_50100 [Vibrio jasicida]